MTRTVWQVDRVGLGGDSRPRLTDVSLTIEPGVTAVLGPSGAGKTSLLNILVGFEQPESGKIARPPENTGKIPFFWGPPDEGLWGHLSAGEHLREVLPEEKRSEEYIHKILTAFDLGDKIGIRPDQLSQGERSRLSVARGLGAEAETLVLDEPLAHVDPARVEQYWERMRSIFNQSGGKFLVFSTHAPETVLREAERVICLEEGRVVYSGPTRDLYESPPTPELAWSLGPANWMADGEGERWLGTRPEHPCVRPERMTVSPAQQSAVVVQTFQNLGSFAALEVTDGPSGQRGRFYCRPSGTAFRPGDRVILRLALLLLSCCLILGCNSSDAAPKLSVKAVDGWSMPAEGTRVPAPRAVHATTDGELYVLDNAGRVLVYDFEGKLLRQWWMPEYSVGKPEKICLFKDGRLAVADTHYHQVVFFDRQGNVVGKMGSFGHEPGQFFFPVAVVQDDQENFYVCEYGDNDRVQKFTKDGKFLLQFGKPGTEPGEFQRPSGIVWLEGKIYVVDAFNNRVQVFSEEGKFLQILGAGDESASLHYPYDITANGEGELFVVEYGAGRVSKFDRQGKMLGRYGSTGSGEGEFATPWGLTVDREARVYVADTGNRRIVQLKL